MTASDDWQERNNEFLAAALEWLRGRLRAAACGHPTDTRSAPASLPASRDAALSVLAERLGLSEFERSVVLLAAAMELDPGLGELCAQAHGDERRPYPTFALALRVLDEPSWDALSPQRPLRYWRLVDVQRQAGEPLVHGCIVADERVVHFVKGLSTIDERLLPFIGSPAATPAMLSAAQERVVSDIARLAATARVFHLRGDPAECRRVIAAAAAQLGVPLAQVHADLLPQEVGELEQLIRLWQRELLLSPAALHLDTTGNETATIRHFASRLPCPVFVTGAYRNAPVTLDVEKPAPAEQAAAWRSALGERAATLAEHFHFGLDMIERVAAGVRDGDDVWHVCLLQTASRFGTLARRIEPRASHADLVLPEAEASLLRQMVTEVRHRRRVLDDWGFRAKTSRGLGVHALFAGESGTGKTLAAEVIAHELRYHLVVIDLSTVVDKYIGETEKNLARIFDAADDGGTVLFFDEADALFGKRAEVKDSHDRYANIEINYLLQRLEAFEGIAILATNMKSALDPAFLRRLRFVVTFPFPGMGERRAIWRRMFPAGAPTSGLDYDHLARLNLTGGSIHAIALGAAYRAAAEGSAITMPLVLEAARAELRKLERPIHEPDFAWSRE